MTSLTKYGSLIFAFIEKVVIIMKKFFPVGFNYKMEIQAIILLYILSVVYSLSFFLSLNQIRNEFLKTNKAYLLKELRFSDISYSNKYMMLFYLLIILAIALISAHYRHHYLGTKSIYTMKMLKNPRELHFRCLIVPVIIILVSVLTIFLLLYIYFQLYLIIIPEARAITNQSFLDYYTYNHLNYKILGR